MSKRIFRTIFAVAIAVLLTASFLIMEVLYNYFETQTKNDLKNQTLYVAQGVENEGVDYIKSLNTSSQRITLIDRYGKVLYDNTANAELMKNHSSREEFIEAQESGFGEARRSSETVGVFTLYYAKLLSDGSVIRLAAGHSTITTLLAGIIQPLAFIFAATLIIALVLASRLSKKIVGPINNLDLEHPDLNDTYDEISPLLGKIMKQKNTIERQLSEERRLRDEFSAITENMSEGFVVIDTATTVLSYNTAALKLLNFTGRTLKGSIYVLNRSEKFRKVVETALTGDRADYIAESGGFFCQIIATPVFEEKHVKGAVILLIDVTEKTERENLRREFSANVSHELKTPLTSISGFAELMTSGNIPREDVVDFSNSILEESRRLITLVNDIIKLSALDEDAVPYDKEKTDLYEIVLNVAEELTDAAVSNKVSISVTGRKGLYISGVPSLLSELVYNLCDNAIKYNKPNGYVEIAVSTDSDKTTLTVSDTGIGIPPDQCNRVFERFYRVDKSHSKEIGGTGLGLSIVKHSAAYHNAEVYLDSIAGEGTKVTVVFPSWRDK